jgi:hypothetical protein
LINTKPYADKGGVIAPLLYTARVLLHLRHDGIALNYVGILRFVVLNSPRKVSKGGDLLFIDF